MDRICVELAVNLQDEQNDLTKINKLLESKKGVRLITSDASNGTIQLEFVPEQSLETNKTQQQQQESDKNCCSINAYTTQKANSQNDLTSNVNIIQRLIEKETGIVTVIKGLGSLKSAVAELQPPETSQTNDIGKVYGVVRLSQLANRKCFVDGLLDGFLTNGDYGGQRGRCTLSIHEFGDMKGEQFNSIGEPIVDIQSKPISELGIKSQPSFAVHKVIPECNVTDMIGRSIAMTFKNDGHESSLKGIQKVISAGVIARAATVDSNKKQICSCSGKTIWEERIERQR